MRRVWITCLLFGCSSGTGTLETHDAGTPNPEDLRAKMLAFCSDSTAAIIGLQARCEGAPIEYLRRYHRSEDRAALEDCADYAVSAANWLELDPVASRACLDALNSYACDENIEPLLACNDIFRGKLGLDADCAFDPRACSEGLICAPSRSDGSCRHLCKPPRIAGERCESSRQCDPALGCYSGTCERHAVIGEACKEGACGDGFCSNDRCVAKGGEGDPCDLVGCAIPLSCQTSADNQRRCAPHPKIGDRCVSADQSCNSLLARCLAGICALAPLDGDACNAELTCAHGFCNDDRKCEPWLEINDPCGADHTCISNYCEENQCRYKLGALRSCNADRQCSSGSCAEGSCTQIDACR